MNKEGYILNIQKKLANGIRLNGEEIRTVVAALRESEHCYQEPYYEVIIFHDKYGNQEHRIMNPENRCCSRELPGDPHLYIVNDRFSVDFRRSCPIAAAALDSASAIM